MKKIFAPLFLSFCILLCGCASPAVSFTPAKADGKVKLTAAPSVIADVTSGGLFAEPDGADAVMFSIGDNKPSVKEAHAACGGATPAVLLHSAADAETVAAYLNESGSEDFFIVKSGAKRS